MVTVVDRDNRLMIFRCCDGRACPQRGFAVSVLKKMAYAAPEAGSAQIPAAGLLASAGAMALEPGDRDGDAFGSMGAGEAKAGATEAVGDKCPESVWLPTLDPPHDATSHTGRSSKARNERTDMQWADTLRRRF